MTSKLTDCPAARVPRSHRCAPATQRCGGVEIVRALARAVGRVLPVVLDGKMHAVGGLADGMIVNAVALDAVMADLERAGRDARRGSR